MVEPRNDILDHCSPIFFEYRLMKEFVLFQQQSIKNVYIIPSHRSPLKWFGVLFIHEGLYQGAVLRFNLYIPENYPDCDIPYPRIVFENLPFHPLVDPETGELNCRKAIPEWKPNINHIWQLISYAKKAFLQVEKELLYDVDPESQESGDLFYLNVVTMYKNNYELFANKIYQSVEQSKSLIYQPPKEKDDQNAIIFTEIDSEVLQELKKKLFTFKNSFDDRLEKSENHGYNNQANSGLSWVQNDTLFCNSVL